MRLNYTFVILAILAIHSAARQANVARLIEKLAKEGTCGDCLIEGGAWCMTTRRCVPDAPSHLCRPMDLVGEPL